MPSRLVLSVGQCGFDHGRISRHLRSAFGAEVRGADTQDEAIAVLRSEKFDLVLVNRVADVDGASGLDLVRALKADPGLAKIPVMLVSNFPDAQSQAESLGALPGFGKGELSSDQATQRLKAVLGGA